MLAFVLTSAWAAAPEPVAVDPWDRCVQQKTVVEGLDSVTALKRCQAEAALAAGAKAASETDTSAALQRKLPDSSRDATPWKHRTPWLVGTAVSLAGASVLYALAADEHAQFLAAPTMSESEAAATGYQADLVGMQSRANGLSYGAYGAAGLGLMLGIGAVITW